MGAKKTRLFLTIGYVVALAVYIFIGFQPADATNYEISGQLSIPAINLASDVANINLENHQLQTPEYIVGAFSNHKNKTLLIAHSSTAFKNLKNLTIEDRITYLNYDYRITDIKTLSTSEIDMQEILAGTKKETIILMTCAGDPLPNSDATHRLIITAEKI